MSYMLERSSLSSPPHLPAMSLLPPAPSHGGTSASSPASSQQPASLSSLASPLSGAAPATLSQLGLLNGALSINPASGALQWTHQQQPQAQQQQLPPQLASLPLSSLAGAAPLSSLSALQQQLGGAASLTNLPPLSQLSQAVSALQQQQQQQPNGLFSPTMPLGSLNLSSLLLPYSSVPPAPSTPQLSSLGGGVALPMSADSSNSALLQLQASLLQAAQAGNAQAIQQLQSLNALMQQHSHAPPAPQPRQPSLPSTPQQSLQSLFGPAALAPPQPDPAGYASRGSSRSPQQLSPPLNAKRGAVSATVGSAFRPRAKRDREDGAVGGGGGGSGSNSGGGSASVSAKQALKSSYLRADVREAVAASQRDGRVPVVPLSAGIASSTDSGGNSSSPTNQLSGDSTNGSSGSGSGSGSGGSGSDEEQMKHADDESDDERDGKRRRKKASSANNNNNTNNGGGSQQPSAKHPFHLFSALDTANSNSMFSGKPPAVPLADMPAPNKDAAANPLLYLYVPQQQQQQQVQQGGAVPVAPAGSDATALSSLLAGAAGSAMSGFPGASSSISNSSAALSALSSYLNGAGPGGQQATPLLPGLDASLQQQLNQQQQQLLQQIQLQHTQQQQQQQQLRQQSAPAQNITVPSPSAPHAVHGTPLHLVSQHFHQTHSGGLSGSDSGSGSGGGSGGHGSGSGGHSQSLLSTSAGSSQSSGGGGGGGGGGLLVGPGGKKLRKKHIVTDRQRRAKIKEGMEQLRGLLSSHGSFTTDQVSIMMASVQLIQKLRTELSSTRQHTASMKTELDRYKQQYGLLPGGQSPASPNASVDAANDRLSPLTLLSAATSQAGAGGAAEGEKADRRSSGGKRSKLSSPLPSPSRSPSLTKPMAAMSVASKDSGSSSGGSGGSGSSDSSSGSDRVDSSEDGSRPSSGDDTSPLPPERADSRDGERSTTPDSASASGRQTSEASSSNTDSTSSDAHGSELQRPADEATVKEEQQPAAMQTS